jgi:3-oxoacyl-[acyl-carrier protein] reductase
LKNVLITGGSRGIGKALVKAFSEAGYKVAFTYNKSEEEALIIAREYSALAVKADSRNEREVLSAISEIREKLGGIDILINNAGISSFSLFTEISLEEWNETFSVNVGGAFLYSKATLPDMISKKWGRIINISSIWGIVGSSCEVHYSASKAALIGLTRALAKELGPSNITVNAIAPGLIDTEMNKTLSDEDKSAFINDTPLSRIGEPQEIAKAALFLASDDASFITGDVLNVSGGYVI